MAITADNLIEREIASLEQEITEKKVKLTRLKRNQPREEISDYELTGPEGTAIKLSEMFGPHDELILVHNMGKSCPYCTMWADGFNGVLKHLENRASFVVVSPDDYASQKEFAAGRNWKFKMYSASGSSFSKDMGFQDEKGDYWPGVSTFLKKDGKIFRVAKDFFGPHDNYCNVWHLFDLLPRGINEWEPKFDYSKN